MSFPVFIVYPDIPNSPVQDAPRRIKNDSTKHLTRGLAHTKVDLQSITKGADCGYRHILAGLRSKVSFLSFGLPTAEGGRKRRGSNTSLPEKG